MPYIYYAQYTTLLSEFKLYVFQSFTVDISIFLFYPVSGSSLYF